MTTEEVTLESLDRKRIRLKSLASFEQKEAEWLVSGYIPKNQITIIGGDGGSGKTSLWCNIIASLSQGKSCILEHEIPFENEEPKKIIFFSSEDSIPYVLKNRLNKNNANMDNIFSISLEDNNFSNVKFDSEELEDILDDYRPDLVIFDPLQSFLPTDTNMTSRNSMREALNPLIALGQRYSVTFIIIMHTNKQKGVWGRKRLADSADMWDIARSVLIVGQDKNKHSYVSQEKSNYGPISDTIIFSLDDGVIQFESTSQQHDQDFVCERDHEQRTKSKQADAEEFILDFLECSENGTCKTAELDQEAYKLKFSVATLRRAKETLKKQKKIVSYSEGYGNNKAWYTKLTKSK